MTAISDTLAERGKRYGLFCEHARISMAIKRAMEGSPNYRSLSDDKREALDMIAHKLGRILNGDPEYRDTWHNIAGYADVGCGDAKTMIQRRDDPKDIWCRGDLTCR